MADDEFEVVAGGVEGEDQENSDLGEREWEQNFDTEEAWAREPSLTAGRTTVDPGKYWSPKILLQIAQEWIGRQKLSTKPHHNSSLKDNNLSVIVSKMNELVIDFGKHAGTHATIGNNSAKVENVEGASGSLELILLTNWHGQTTTMQQSMPRLPWEMTSADAP